MSDPIDRIIDRINYKGMHYMFSECDECFCDRMVEKFLAERKTEIEEAFIQVAGTGYGFSFLKLVKDFLEAHKHELARSILEHDENHAASVRESEYDDLRAELVSADIDDHG